MYITLVYCEVKSDVCTILTTMWVQQNKKQVTQVGLQFANYNFEIIKIFNFIYFIYY